MSRSILVTGGCGFIGATLVPMLVQRGHSVRVLDNLSRSALSEFPDMDVEIVCADIRDTDAVSEALTGVDSVVHLAAYGSVMESIQDPVTNFSINAAGTLNMLQQSAEKGVQKFVFASTGGALIGNALPPVDEDSVPKPISPYGASKLCGEGYCHAFAKSYDLETACLRFGNVYGPHSAHKKGAVTLFIKGLLKDEPIVIYGDGSASRDYVHTEDLCSGITAAMNAALLGGDVFHIASGRETTVLELANILRDVSGKSDHPIEFRDARQGEVSRNFANYDAAKAAIGFEPKWRLEDGLAATWEWFTDLDDDLLSLEATDS